MRNLILTQYLLYGQHIGLSVGGPRDHIKTVTIKTTTLLTTKPPLMIPGCRIVSKRVPKWHPKWLPKSIQIQISLNMIPNFPKMVPNGIPMTPKWAPNDPQMIPKSDQNRSFNGSRYNAIDRKWLEETSNARHHKQTHTPANPRRHNNWLLINGRE